VGAQLAWGLAALAAILLLSSLGRALRYVKGLEARFAKTFGPAQTPALPGAPARTAPLVLGDLLSVPTPW
jgi:hypothetical protein